MDEDRGVDLIFFIAYLFYFIDVVIQILIH